MPFLHGLPVYIVWNEIAYQLESTKDLLSLALSCRALKEIIIPNHLEYRIIRCDVSRTDVWKHLASRPALARGVRVVDTMLFKAGDMQLCLLPRRFHKTPSASVYYPRPVTEESMVLLKDALSHMTCLNDFAWSQEMITTRAFTDISNVLPPHLEGLCINFFTRSQSFAGLKLELSTVKNLSAWGLTGLKRLIIYEITETATQMALSCPQIEDLLLDELSNSSISYLMQYANWKNLRRFSLNPSSTWPSLPAEDSAIITSFFGRHGTIESLVLSLADYSMPFLPPTCLPNLQSISANEHLVSSLPPEITSCIVHWQCLKAETDHEYVPYPNEAIDADVLPLMDNLESLYVTGQDNFPDNITRFLCKAPYLKKISFQIGDPDWYDSDPEELPGIFRFSNNLTHIFFDFELIPPDDEGHNYNERERLENLYESLCAIKTLKYVQTPWQPFTDPEPERGDEHGTRLRHHTVELERDEHGIYSGHHPVELETPKRWGNFFRRLTD